MVVGRLRLLRQRMLAVGRDAARITPDLDLRRLLLERIDVVHDRELPQDHLADDMARLDVFGVDRRIAGGTGRKTSLTRTTNGAAVMTAAPETII